MLYLLYPTSVQLDNVGNMSAAKRSRVRQEEAATASPLPGSKRLKTSHVPQTSGLGFLVDEDARAGRKLEARLTNGVHNPKASRVDESHARVAQDSREEEDGEGATVDGHEIIDISSAEDESSEYESSDEEVAPTKGSAVRMTNGHKSEDKPAKEAEEAEEDEEEGVELGAGDDRMEDVQENGDVASPEKASQEPSFGDLLQARYPGPINVHTSANAAPEEKAVVPATSSRALATLSATSLGVVLTQALKTNDKDLLESCLRVTNLPSIKSTITRLPSHLASTLLTRLAERVHRAPGRTGNLMVWIQWTLVTHGGYLSTQPDTMRKLRSLSQVVRERASGLQPLLHLKGKLELLSAQLEHRQHMQAMARIANAQDEEDEDAVVYVEGQDDYWSDEGEVAGADVAMLSGVDDSEGKMPVRVPRQRAQQLITPQSDAESGDDESDDEDLPNGVAQEIDEDEEEDEDENESLFDEEADVSDDDEGEDLSTDEEASSAPESEDDSEVSEDESEPEIKTLPAKKLNRRR